MPLDDNLFASHGTWIVFCSVTTSLRTRTSPTLTGIFVVWSCFSWT